MLKSLGIFLVYFALYSTGIVTNALYRFGYGSYTSFGHLNMGLNYIVFIFIAVAIWVIFLLVLTQTKVCNFRNLNFLSLIAILSAFTSSVFRMSLLQV